MSRWKDAFEAHMAIATHKAENRKMRSEIEEITPEIARQMLLLNVGNRKLRTSSVTKLATAIASGNWKLTHQGIALAPDGRVLDGQHRLAAIIEAKRPVLMMVSRDCDPDSYLVLDQGVKRTYGDALKRKAAEVTALRWAVGFSKPGNPEANARTCTIGEVADAAEWFGAYVDLVVSSCNVTQKTRTSGTILFAIALRVGMGQAAKVLPWWRSFVLFHLQDINPSVASLLKRLDNGTLNVRLAGLPVVLATYQAFDPMRQDVPLGGLRNEGIHIEEIRSEIGKIIARKALPK